MIVRHKAISLLLSFQSALQVPNVLSRNNCIFYPSCCIFASTVKISFSCSSNKLFVRCGFCPSILIPPNSSSRDCDLPTVLSRRNACLRSDPRQTLCGLLLLLKGLVARSGLSAGDGSTRKTGSAPKRACRFLVSRFKVCGCVKDSVF